MSLPQKTFDAVGVERSRGNHFVLAPYGKKAGFFCEGDEGSFEAEITFPENADRVFFVRGSHNARKEIRLRARLKKNANITFVVGLSEKSHGETDFSLETHLSENAHLSLLFFHFSEGISRVQIKNMILEKGGSSNIKTSFFGKKSASGEISVRNIALKKETSGDLRMRAALANKAALVMRGTPVISPTAKNAKNHLDQKTLLLSSSAKIRALPALEVATNPVEASHKSSLSRLSLEDLFYCASRGISEKSAEEILQKSFLAELLAEIPDEPLRQEISEFATHFFEKKS